MNNAEKVAYIHSVRRADLEALVERAGEFIRDKDALEIGAGTGYQLSILRKICRSAMGIDLKAGPYAKHQVEGVLDYDGVNIPFPDQTFDLIFSSSVLEHVTRLDKFHGEMRRVLRPYGVAVHILPSHYWRISSVLMFYPSLLLTVIEILLLRRRNDKDFGVGSSQTDIEAVETGQSKRKITPKVLWQHGIPRRHGERGNVFSEIGYFHPAWWRREFTDNDWEIVACYPTGIFHSGRQLLGNALPMAWRKRLASVFGSSTYTFVLRPATR